MSFDAAFAADLVRRLRQRGWQFAPGLSDREVSRIERKYGIRFPPDLLLLHQYALPIHSGHPFSSLPNWRDGPELVLRRWLRSPWDGMAFDIEKNEFWMDDWGEKPADLKGQLAIAHQAFEAAPRLIPIFGHRFIPDEPHELGNPVLSVMQTDIIIYGNDLADYFTHDFQARRPAWAATTAKRIPFWSRIVFKFDPAEGVTGGA